MSKTTQLKINKATINVKASDDTSLLNVLRDELGLTGTKYGCGEGQCGACTVLLDGQATRSCITPLRVVGGREVTTIEGLENNGKLHPLQESFLERDALQCGYCTSGMIMSGVALLSKNPHPSREEIIRFMNGNVCRCGTYSRIVAAFELAAASPKEALK